MRYRISGALAPLAVTLALTLQPAPARSEVTRFEVVSRDGAALGGRTFGGCGAAEKITARATIALDPADPRNAVIADIDRAPRNAGGRVEATTDVVILRPACPSGTLLFEVVNRGRKLLPAWAQDAEAGGALRLAAPEDAGNGFLLERGYTLVWAGWQFDTPAGPDLLRIEVPTAAGITGPSREEFTFTDTATPKRVTLSYPAAERGSARITLRDRTDLERMTPEGLALRFVDDTTVEIDRLSGVAPGALYEITYTARDPRLSGMGLAAMRDVTSFLRRETGPANPLAAGGRTGIDRAVGLGISQSGRALRDLLYFGMNEDEAGRIVFEGVLPIIPGARRSFTNARFAQPGRNPGPQYDRLYPVLAFPFTYPVLEDGLSGKRDGILLRCRLNNTCPKIIHLDSEFEFWGSQASLLVTDTRGNHLDLPPDVRIYLLSGAPHGNPPNAVSRPSAACVMPLNPINGGPALRALLVAMEAWLRVGTEPPASRFPMRAHGTLVPAAQAYPAIPGLPYRGQLVRADLIEQAAPLPEVRGSYPLFVPRAGLDGNAIAGIRLPLIEAPRATYVGWNAQAGAEGPQEICTQVGGVVPFAATRAEREAARDPRPSLEELYPSNEAYLSAVRAATERLVSERLLLPADAEEAIRAAGEGRLARLR
ncbi:alpha/beta hydrolase domain-containing protein [Muricoccus pecuniae]|uniref:Alpha/beta hydrolase domain-containing protein n=1 Tax=Muricoccus pecuniae TaxID=693023 RepID=A0A840XX14_9PROT|nr:alpha/beta hydrolase domain-containing protein [Roseomonas pecuniae]MBB5692426.1 hypothetical protein [Roseomonas pecuniae]